MLTIDDDECPGEGKCHGCMKWCADCGDVKRVCDVRLEGNRCDEHPVPPDWNTLRKARVDAERQIREGERIVREGKRALEEVEDQERAARAYGDQRAKEEARFWVRAGGMSC